MSVYELQKRNANLESEIVSTKQALDESLQRRQSTLSETEIEALTSQIQTLEKKLEKKQILKMAIDKELRKYQANAPQAAKLRDEIQPAVQTLTTILVGLKKAQQDAISLLNSAIDPLGTIEENARRHEELVGERLSGLPMWNQIIPQGVREFIGCNLADSVTWQYESDEQRVEKTKKRDAELRAASKRLKDQVQAQAPPCDKCGQTMHGRDDVPPQKDRLGRGWWLSFVCNRHVPQTMQNLLVEELEA